MPFVGRAAHFEQLESVWTAVRSGSPRTVFVGGEPGVGKTRLASEVADAVRASGAQVLWGASHPDLNVPFQPFATALGQLLEHAEEGSLSDVLGDSARHLVAVVPHVLRHRPDLDGVADRAEESRASLFDAVRDLVVALTRQRPMLLVLEDLHWSTTPTQQLLAHLVQTAARCPLLILVTHRTTAPDRSDPLTFAIADLYRHDGVSRIDLHGLSTAEVTDYLIAGAGMPREDARRAAAVLRDQTDGNPFFIRELWRDISTRGGVQELRRAGVTAPVSVRDALDRRLSQLEAAHVEVLEAAAVAGDDSDLAVLLDACEHPADVALAAVDVGVASGLLHADPSTGRFRFVHALARQAVQDRMPPSRLVHLHACIAHALERRPRRDPEVVARLAHHCSRAHALGLAEQAVSYLVGAATHAERTLAHEEAASLYERAAELPPATAHAREDLLFAAARSHVLAGEFPRARATYEALAQSSDPDVLLRAAIGYEDTAWRPGVLGDRALELLQTAVRTRTGDVDDPLHVHAMASTGRAYSFVGDHDRSQALGEEALAHARRIGDPELLTHALCATLWRGMTPALAPQLLSRAVELSDLAASIGSHDALGSAAFYRAVFGYMLGRPVDWQLGREDMARAVRAGGQPFFRYVSGCALYARQLTSGRFADAAGTISSLEDLGTSFGPDTADGSTSIQTFMLRRETGGLEAVRPLITGEEDLAAHWLPGLLALYRELGLWEAAGRALSSLVDEVEAWHAVSSQWAGVLAFLVESATVLQDVDAAARLLPLAKEYEGLNLIAGQFVAVFGSADRYVAELESLLGVGDVDQRFATALEVDRRTGSTLHQVETLRAWALHVDRRGGDDGRSRVLLAEAAALVQQMDEGWSPRLMARPTSRQTPGGRALPDGLTARELDVLRLVAAGLSNREIGARISISQNTAANHVRSILMKTGAANRTSAAMYAAEHDLLVPT